MDQVMDQVRCTSTWIMDRWLNLVMQVTDWQADEEQSLLSSHLIAAAGLVLVILLLLMASVLFFRQFRGRVRETILPDPTKPRFRKRDKVLFLGRQMLRKMRSSIRSSLLLPPVGSKANPRVKGRKRQAVLRFAKRLLRLRKETPLSLLVKEPSQAFLEEATSPDQRDTGLPKEVSITSLLSLAH